MTWFVRTLVGRLLALDREAGQGGLSRNRHFEVFADDQGRHAHHLYRRLRGLVSDLRRADPAAVDLQRRRDAERPIALRIPLPGGTRTAYLTEAELQLLRETLGLDGLPAS